MQKQCRYRKTHRHVILPRDSEYTVTMAEDRQEPGERVKRIRWLTDERVWEVCYEMKEDS